VAKGGDGVDFLSGGDHDDILAGEDGVDNISGDSGSDILLGGNGDDNLFGGANPDTVIGGLGGDFLKGQGSSNDVHVGQTAEEGSDDDEPDPNDVFVEPDEVDNAFVLDTAILDRLNSF